MNVITNLKVNLILKITIFFWLVTKIISFKLWTSDRLFPVIPTFNFLENCPNWFHLTLYLFGICTLVFVFFYPNKKNIIGLTILLEITSCLLDQNRWQPYQYHFILIFCFAFFLRDNKNFINYFIFLLFVIYVNSGLHKLNGGFLYYIWENLMLKQFFGLENYQINNIIIHYLGLFIGLFEFFCGLGLLFSKFKKIAAVLLIAMHFFIIILLSPIGIAHNYVVLPWNCAMILFLWVIYFSNINNTFNFWVLVKGYHIIFFVLIGLMPIFNFFGLYDNYLSFKLYSGNLQKMYICVHNDKDASRYKSYFLKDRKEINCQNIISISYWSLKEMNVLVNPEKRVFIKIAQKWKEINPNIEATFYLVDYPYQSKNFVQISESGNN
ncbi:hypothetical protein [Flavobacterium chungnamense]|uniref:HTTM domain-containing protein n=1 Tax=Flavobacterium chungnamense TaxID=706182 RepID=A0ABP7UXE4_9FLAO